MTEDTNIFQSDSVNQHAEGVGIVVANTENDVIRNSHYYLQDSTFKDSVGEEIFPRTIFSSQLQDEKMTRQERPAWNYDWITIHLILCFGLIALVQFYFSKRLKQIVKSVTGKRYLNQLIREGNIFRERIAIPLFIIYLVVFSLLLYLLATEILKISVFQLESLKLYSFIVVIVLFTWIVKNVILMFIGNLFRNHLVLSVYLLDNFVFNIFIGLILLPVLVPAVYFDSVEMVYVGLILWLIIYFYRLLRQFLTELSYTKFSWYYRILYLCTFEIVPFLVFTKLVMSYLT